MANFIFIDKDIFKQLTEDELLIYCYGAFQTKLNEEFIFSSSILNYYLDADTRRQQNKFKTALESLVAKGLILNVANDVYIIKETKKTKAYFVLYDIEFEALKGNSKLLRYFCYLVSCFNNETQQWKLSNSFIQKGYGISKATIISYNKALTELNLIKVITRKKDNDNNNINIIKRVNISDEYKKASNEKAKETEEKILTTSKETVKSNNKDNLKIRVAEAMAINESEFVLSPKHKQCIEEAGADNFIKILKSIFTKYAYFFNDNKFIGWDTQRKVNTILKKIIDTDLQRELSEMKRREQEITTFMYSDEEVQQFSDYMDSIENETQKPKNKKTIDMSSVFEELEQKQETKLLWEM